MAARDILEAFIAGGDELGPVSVEDAMRALNELCASPAAEGMRERIEKAATAVMDSVEATSKAMGGPRFAFEEFHAEICKLMEREFSGLPGTVPQASSACPVCGLDTPHSHSDDDISKWVDAQASRFGYAARAWKRDAKEHKDLVGWVCRGFRQMEFPNYFDSVEDAARRRFIPVYAHPALEASPRIEGAGREQGLKYSDHPGNCGVHLGDECCCGLVERYKASSAA